MEEDIRQELKLKKAILDSVIMLLDAMEFSQEEGAVEADVSMAIKNLTDAEVVYSEWVGGSCSD